MVDKVIIFAWAKSLASFLEKRWLDDLSTYVDKVGCIVALYHDDTTRETLMCDYRESENKFSWCVITNFPEIREKNPELINLWLRNGEYLYTYITGGKGLGVVNLPWYEGWLRLTEHRS